MRGGAVERGQGLVREFEGFEDLGVLKIWGF
jgi:hypothetical protein